MNKFISKIKNIISSGNYNIFLAGFILFSALIIISAFFDLNLALGLIFSSVLTAILFFVIFKLKNKDKNIFILFLIVFVFHLLMVLFIYYTGFRPSGGGADFENYHNNATLIAERFKGGNFSLKGTYSNHYYPLLIGIIYTLTASKIIIGQVFSAWLAAFSVILLYFLILEIGGSKKSAFIAGLFMSFYPSYMYFGSLLLKDTVVVPLVLLSLILAIQIMKKFDGLKFLLFFIFVTSLTHFRFYVGFALIFSFIISWFILSNLKFAERFILGLAIIAILGFSPQIAGFKEYYGSDLFFHYLNTKTVKQYREVVYAPLVVTEVSESQGGNNSNTVKEKSGTGSSFVVPSGVNDPVIFAKNYAVSFNYSFLGPFPWQLKYLRHLYFLADTVPFYILFAGFVYWLFVMIKNNGFMKFILNNKFCLTLLLFSIMALGALSILINNFGIIARIRIPMYIVLLAVFSLSFEYILSSIKKFKKVSHE